MIKHNIIIALRNIAKNWRYSVINIGGLAIGLASTIFIGLYIEDELKYDRFNEKADRTYRVNRLYNTNEVNEDAATLEFPGGPEMQREYPDIIEKVVRFFNFQRSQVFTEYIKNNREKVSFNEKNFFVVDSTVFDVFSFPFLLGDPKTALDRPNTMVITESTAKKYFGDESPLGKTLRLENFLNFEITGVIKDIPTQSHFKIDMLGSMSTIKPFFGGQLPTTWIWNPCWTYVLLQQGIRPEVLEEKFPAFYKNHYFDLKNQDVKLYLQKLTDIHLKSHHVYEMHANSNIIYVYILSIIAVIVLILACINFMNLSTASSAGRAKEISIKKLYGGTRPQITWQFLGEAIVQTLFAMIIALVIVDILLPAFDGFTGKNISSFFVFEPDHLLVFLLLSAAVGLLAGIYPALFLASFKPLVILKSNLKNGVKTGLARRILVIFQFAISIALIIATFIVFAQLKFLRNTELGFKKDQIITIQSVSPLIRNYDAFREELLKNKDILYVTGSEDVLGVNHNTRAYQIEGLTPGQSNYIPTFMIAWDFIETYDIKVVAGRAFSRDFPSDTLQAVMINETMAKDLGWTNESALGKRIKSQDGDERVIGVFKDFNALSLHKPVEKFILDMFRVPRLFSNVISVRVNTRNYKEVVGYISKVWSKYVPDRPFEYQFLDSQLNDLYRDDVRFGRFTLLLTILAIIIAGMGLVGLSSFLSSQRTKEIGIRRVMGASTGNIVKLLFREYLMLVLLANLVAWPATYLYARHWLSGYSRHIGANLSYFVLSGLIALLLALMVVGYRAMKTAHLNPSDTLRYE